MPAEVVVDPIVLLLLKSVGLAELVAAVEEPMDKALILQVLAELQILEEVEEVGDILLHLLTLVVLVVQA